MDVLVKSKNYIRWVLRTDYFITTTLPCILILFKSRSLNKTVTNVKKYSPQLKWLHLFYLEYNGKPELLYLVVEFAV